MDGTIGAESTPGEGSTFWTTSAGSSSSSGDFITKPIAAALLVTAVDELTKPQPG